MAQKPRILLLAGFGDGAEMYAGLEGTCLAKAYDLLPVDFPGFAGSPALSEETTLAALATFVDQKARQEQVDILVAHSVASIIAALAALKAGSPIHTVISLEGNLTTEDAYFSGMAADYPDPETFKEAFLGCLAERASNNPIISRYRAIARQADAKALWVLGCDARHYSEATVPGEVLSQVKNVWYFYNPENCPEPSLAWLRNSSMNRVELRGASHWPSVDVPDLLSEKILQVLEFVV